MTWRSRRLKVHVEDIGIHISDVFAAEEGFHQAARIMPAAAYTSSKFPKGRARSRRLVHGDG